VCSKVLRKLTNRTDTTLDDIVLDLIEEPIVFAFAVVGIWFGLGQLQLPETVDAWIWKSIQFLIVLSVTWLISRLLNSLFTLFLAPLAEKSENDLDNQLLPIVRKGTTFTVWSLGIIVALNNAGYDVAAVLAGLGIGGIALAMAAKDTVSNVFGGFTIFTDRPFKINDRIKVGGFDGSVSEIGIRSTRLRTLAGTLVTIPNSTFSATAVENVSEEPSRKVSLNLGLTYDTTPDAMERAMDLLRGVASSNPNLEEKVIVGFSQFGDFALNITMIYYITSGADITATQTDINMEILRTFADEGLEFAFPTQTLYTIAQD
jgi:MscS family membrane protein